MCNTLFLKAQCPEIFYSPIVSLTKIAHKGPDWRSFENGSDDGELFKAIVKNIYIPLNYKLVKT